MLRFKISAERLAAVCTVPEYTAAIMGSVVAKMTMLPKFLLDEQGNDYVVSVVVDADGDITDYVDLDKAKARMNVITPKRLQLLMDEMGAAMRDLVNPPKGKG